MIRKNLEMKGDIVDKDHMAKALGLAPTSYPRLESKGTISEQTIIILEDRFNVNREWLLSDSFEGDMFKKVSIDSAEVVNEFNKSIQKQIDFIRKLEEGEVPLTKNNRKILQSIENLADFLLQ